jgi:kynureninase
LPITDDAVTFTDASEAFARDLDASDPLAHTRERFHIPGVPGSEADKASVYLVGNSLGCMPRAAAAQVEREMEDWRTLGVEAHLNGRVPWYSYAEALREPTARVVGALPDEVVTMNSLTVNLHLMMASFYRPEGNKAKIVIEDAAFPSDSYAVASQIVHHGLDPREHLIRLKPRAGEHTLRTDDICTLIGDRRDEIALVLLPGVNYRTGQCFDMQTITAAARGNGVRIGWDMAHAAGNVPTRLHDWEPDFAVWCSYKYLNGGPGATAGCFVHERHLGDNGPPRLAGWWGNDPATRFEMVPEFVPVPRADAWAMSNPSVLAMAPLRASLAIFDEVGIDNLRAKSLQLTSYLAFLIDDIGCDDLSLLTPRPPEARGCQLSIAVEHDAQGVHAAMGEASVTVDFRRPNIIRAAPTPLYNTFHDVWTFANVLKTHVSAGEGQG